MENRLSHHWPTTAYDTDDLRKAPIRNLDPDHSHGDSSTSILQQGFRRSSEERLRSPSPGCWHRSDSGILAAALLLLFSVAFACGYRRIFWEDEMLGWMMLRDPSFLHMLDSWRHGADGGGLTFYLTGRLWFRVFGSSVLSFRMYSQCAFALGFSVTWISMRRFYRVAVVAFACLCVWLVSPALVQHLTEGRFYGLLVAGVALGVALNLWMIRSSFTPLRAYVATFIVHALLVTSHILGIVYSAALLTMLILLEHQKRRRNLALYACAVCSWLLLVPCLPAIRASAAVGKPFFWTSQPTLAQFLTDYTGFTLILGIPIAALATVTLLVLAKRRIVRFSLSEAVRSRKAVYVVVGVFSAIPLLFLLEGTIGPPLCVSRYLLPMIVPTTWFLAELITIALTLTSKRLQSNRLVLASGWSIFLLALLAYDFGYRTRHTTLQKDYTELLTKILPRGTPVICEDAFAFSELISRQHQSPVRYVYLLDWPTALAPDAPRLEVTQYHLMENWRRAGYFSGSILYASDLLGTYPVFYSLSFEDSTTSLITGRTKLVDRSSNIGSSLHRRLSFSPNYKVTQFLYLPLGDLSASVWRICRVGSSAC